MTKTMNNAEELRMLVKLEDRSRDYVDKAMLSAAAELDRLQEVLTFPIITPEASSHALFIRVLSEHEHGRPVNGQDLINALMWRVRNQRQEIARLQAKRAAAEPVVQRIAVETPQSRSLFDMADNLIREMRKHDMWGMRSEYDNWTLRITRNEPAQPKAGEQT